MVKCVVIADDLTGANATGVMLKKMNYKTSTIINMKKVDLQKLDDCDCATFTTDSRGVDPEVAYNRVYNVTKLCQSDDIEIYANRIDSTLRGNMGKETDAMLDVLGEDYIGICVPCAPASGRITLGGHMLVNGIVLNRTEAALDPKTPITDSKVRVLFEKQSKYKTASIYMEDIDKGLDYLKEKILWYAKDGVRIIICDSVNQEDIDMIADASIATGLHFISIDPGAFTASLLRKKVVLNNPKQERKILAVVGSVNPVAKTQMEYFWLSQPVLNIFAETKKFLSSDEDRASEIIRVSEEILSHMEEYDLFSVTGDGIMPDHRLDFRQFTKPLGKTVDEISELINQSMAEITYRILSQNDAIEGLYTSGGDITAAVCRRFNTMGISLKDEVIPLAACGRFIEGEFPGKWIVTKGGMTGNQDAINTCVLKLKAMLNI